MELLSLTLIFLWLIPLWLCGWLILPAVRHLFPLLPDGGLAPGRLLFLALASLVAFWLASLRLAPLTVAPWLVLLGPFLVSVLCLHEQSQRTEFFEWTGSRKRSLIASDLVFLAAFGIFVFIRLCQPEIQGQEKPMDSAIIGVLARSEYLPAQNPWFSGTLFTNYYYFGHFMAALLTRSFQTPLPYAYNLTQPVFCAFFISILWSLCAALTRSSRLGAVAVFIIAFCGNYEPLRQLAAAWREGGPWWPLDWWSTSRVVPFTINEYPFFTLTIGDAHAHFFALPLSALLLCLCYCAVSRQRHALLLLLTGLCLGVLLMTNSWNVPFWLLAAAIFLGWNRQQEPWTRTSVRIVATFLALTTLTIVAALPLLLSFEPHVSGWEWVLWKPPVSTLLVWGGFIGTSLILLLIVSQRRIPVPQLLGSDTTFILILFGAGVAVVLVPFFLTIHGHVSGDWRHLNTVFKFWLQGWLFLGISIICTALKAFAAIPPGTGKRLFQVGFATLWLPPLLCTAAIADQIYRKSAFAPPHSSRFSLNGTRFLSPDEQQAIGWLTIQAEPGESVLEAVGEDAAGRMIGAYSDFGRVSSLSGVPAWLGWPQHAGFWGASPTEFHDRWQQARKSYIQPGSAESEPFTYIYFGGAERSIYGEESRARLRATHREIFRNATVSIFQPSVSRETYK